MTNNNNNNKIMLYDANVGIDMITLDIVTRFQYIIEI